MISCAFVQLELSQHLLILIAITIEIFLKMLQKVINTFCFAFYSFCADNMRYLSEFPETDPKEAKMKNVTYLIETDLR